MATYTERALATIDRLAQVAYKDNSTANTRGIAISPKGYFFYQNSRISRERAIEQLACIFELEEKVLATTEPQRKTGGKITWDSLNQATKDFFFELSEQMQSATQDHNNGIAVRLGHDIPKISPQNQPRLTNLKKAGVVRSFSGTTKSHKMIQLSEQGQAIWLAHVGG